MSEAEPRYQFIELAETDEAIAIIQDTDNAKAWLQSSRYVSVDR